MVFLEIQIMQEPTFCRKFFAYLNVKTLTKVFYLIKLECSLDELKLGTKALSEVFEFDLPKMQEEKPDQVTSNDADVCDRCGRNLYASE